ncbi:MAG: ROK family transcriptional regulator [Clostridiales bacterium]|nr:ROK family transcriptional regulator [Clostridiales bacterium]
MATQSSVRISNQELIIQYLMKNGETSRAKLAKNLNISKPTISLNAEKLIEKEILMETGEGESSGGRKPTLLNFNYNHRILVAIDLNRNQPLIALSNLSGQLKFSTTLEMEVTEKKPFLVQRLTTAINDLITSHDYDLSSLGAISIAVPGVIDDLTDEIFANPQDNLWTDLKLKKVLSEIYHVPVIMKNDISMAALGEKHYGVGQNYDDLMYVSSGSGVGAGLIVNGELFQGKRNFAGEIGFSKINGVDGKTLEESISTPVLLEKIKQDIEEGQETLLSKDQMDSLKISDIQKAIESGDVYLTDLMKASGVMLGIVVANVALIMDLETVIIGGVLSEVSEVFIEGVAETVKKIMPFKTKIYKSKLGQVSGIYGLLVVAKSLVLNRLID